MARAHSLDRDKTHLGTGQRCPDVDIIIGLARNEGSRRHGSPLSYKHFEVQSASMESDKDDGPPGGTDSTCLNPSESYRPNGR